MGWEAQDSCAAAVGALMFEDSTALPQGLGRGVLGAGVGGKGGVGQSVYFTVWYENTVRMSMPVQSVHQYVCVPRPLRFLRFPEFGLMFEGFPFKLIVGICRTECEQQRRSSSSRWPGSAAVCYCCSNERQFKRVIDPSWLIMKKAPQTSESSSSALASRPLALWFSITQEFGPWNLDDGGPRKSPAHSRKMSVTIPFHCQFLCGQQGFSLKTWPHGLETWVPLGLHPPGVLTPQDLNLCYVLNHTQPPVRTFSGVWAPTARSPPESEPPTWVWAPPCLSSLGLSPKPGPELSTQVWAHWAWGFPGLTLLGFQPFKDLSILEFWALCVLGCPRSKPQTWCLYA